MSIVSPELQLLIVDDETDFRETAVSYFRHQSYRVQSAASAEDALQAMRNSTFDVAVIDLHMPGMDGLELLKRMLEEDSQLQVVMLTGGASVETAVEAMRRGASDYLSKPIRLAELDVLIQKAYHAGRVQRENSQLRQVLKRSVSSTKLIGKSEAMEKVNRLIARTSASDKPILIEGESGTGKELVARAIHQASPLAEKPLVVINCAALPETLLESELFGHEKGAFTGAIAAKPGLFEIADGGTLFIDEFGELAGSLQAKLLRVLEDGVIRRIGSVKERRVRARILAATNRNLVEEVKAGRFREDLYYRVNILTIHLPPLRERQGDVPLLVQAFTNDGWKLEPGVMEVLERYSWPGNVRQLLNALERAKILADDDYIRLANLPPEIMCKEETASAVKLGPQVDLETLNRMHVVDVLNRYHGNKARTAKALGIGRRSLYRLLEKYGLHSAEMGVGVSSEGESVGQDNLD
jgi:DNA-binding NtrC family response regulator